MNANRSSATSVRRRWLLSGCVVLACAAGAAAQGEFPYTSGLGRAAVQYRGPDLHVVAAYYYSQRNHDSRWLLIEAAVSTTRLMTIPREAFVLRTPGGREIPLATQRRFGADIARVRPLLQNASTSQHDVASYFNQRDRTDGMRFFTLPFGGVVHDDFVADPHRVVVGDLFFEAPTGAWEDGIYSLVVRHEDVHAEVPIELE